eukprot:scaffold258314_cov35-Tisochrysis_lutea.AAC.1
MDAFQFSGRSGDGRLDRHRRSVPARHLTLLAKSTDAGRHTTRRSDRTRSGRVPAFEAPCEQRRHGDRVGQDVGAPHLDEQGQDLIEPECRNVSKRWEDLTRDEPATQMRRHRGTCAIPGGGTSWRGGTMRCAQSVQRAA